MSPILAAILDSEKAKPIASSHPGKILSTYHEQSKNAKNDCYQRLHTSAQIWASASGLISVARKHPWVVELSAYSRIYIRGNVSLYSRSCWMFPVEVSYYPQVLPYKAAVSLQVVCVCLPPFFRHDRRTATKFGTPMRIDLGAVLKKLPPPQGGEF